MNIDIVENKIIKCINNARSILISKELSDKVVGINPLGDISREFDVETEEVLASCLRDELVDVIIIGEEKGVQIHGEKKFVVMIDPVDGSTNYEADIPWSAISIAVANGDKNEPKLSDVFLAVVAEVVRDRIYIYSDGVIKILGSKNIVRKNKPKNVVLGYIDSYTSYKILKLYSKSYNRFKVLRILGSAALDILSVGLGNAEVFIDLRKNKLRNIDIAAALRIALALGAKAFIPGYKNSLDIPVDRIVRVSCIVGFNDFYLGKVLEILKRIDFQDLIF